MSHPDPFSSTLATGSGAHAEHAVYAEQRGMTVEYDALFNTINRVGSY